MNVYAGPPRALTRITLRLVPLTPVHIGDGTEMRLDEYLLEEPRRAGRRYDEFGEEIEEQASEAPPMLCRFDQAKAMRAMTPAQRSAFQRALDAGQLGEAAKALREAGRGAIVERIPISPRSAAELRKAFDDPLSRSGQVKPFVRSGGKPYIPGSSIKGAFRTALASAALPRGSRPDAAWTHETALEKAFGLEPGRTETDPLRFLHVSDAVLPEGATEIVETEVVKAGGRLREPPIRMYVEIARGRAFDAASRVNWETVLSVDARASYNRAELFRATSEFHWGIWQNERQRFFADCRGTREAMDRLLQTVKVAGGTLADQGFAAASNYVLLRLGRFGHFESKSLEGVRTGIEEANPKKGKPKRTREPGEWGLTRTVTRDANKNPIPFGWVIGWVVKEEPA